MTPERWEDNRAILLDAKARVALAVSDLGAAVTGFRRAPYIKRAAMGSTVHDGWFHLGSGWHHDQPLIPGHYRTRDFKIAERSNGPPNVCFQEMASFEGSIWRGPGLEVYPAVYGDDLTTSDFFRSETGGYWQQAAGPTDSFETGFLLETVGGLVSGLGLRYNPVAPYTPTYIINRNIWRKPRGGGAWELRNSNGPALRSFAFMDCANGSFLFGGADNTNGPDGRIDSGRVLRTTDGFSTLVDVGPLPGGARYGLRGVWMGENFVLLGGGTGHPVQNSTQVWWSATPWVLESFVPGTPLPLPMMHFAAGSLLIDGVWTLGVIGGYPNADGGPLGTVFTITDLTGPWTDVIDSDFRVP